MDKQNLRCTSLLRLIANNMFLFCHDKIDNYVNSYTCKLDFVCMWITKAQTSLHAQSYQRLCCFTLESTIDKLTSCKISNFLASLRFWVEWFESYHFAYQRKGFLAMRPFCGCACQSTQFVFASVLDSDQIRRSPNLNRIFAFNLKCTM